MERVGQEINRRVYKMKTKISIQLCDYGNKFKVHLKTKNIWNKDTKIKLCTLLTAEGFYQQHNIYRVYKEILQGKDSFINI